MGNVFGKVPAYTTIGYWMQELGLSVYKESCSLFKDKRYALIVDESLMIGSEKLLLTLAMPAINAGSAITEKDVTIVDISIAKSWNGTSIKNVLEKVADKIRQRNEIVSLTFFLIFQYKVSGDACKPLTKHMSILQVFQ